MKMKITNNTGINLEIVLGVEGIDGSKADISETIRTVKNLESIEVEDFFKIMTISKKKGKRGRPKNKE